MNYVAAGCLLALLGWGSLIGSRLTEQQSAGTFQVRGRVVLFDWKWHADDTLLLAEDLVVRLSGEEDSLPRHIRLIYPGVAIEAPDEIKEKHRLSNQLFVGRGSMWRFEIIEPKGSHLQLECNRVAVPVTLEDELGDIELSPYSPTPGALDEDTPPVHTLPCFILVEKPTIEGNTTAFER